MSTAVQITAAAALVLGGLAVLITGWRGLRGTLPPNRFVGVRTSATMSSDDAYRVGNRAAGPATMAGGAVALAVGACLPAVPGLGSGVVLLVVGVLGAVFLMGVGGAIGHRAAEAMPEPSTGGCSGCAGGCCSALTKETGAGQSPDQPDGQPQDQPGGQQSPASA